MEGVYSEIGKQEEETKKDRDVEAQQPAVKRQSRTFNTPSPMIPKFPWQQPPLARDGKPSWVTRGHHARDGVDTCCRYDTAGEAKADITSKAVVDILIKTSEYLQPNPATRAKLSMLNTVSKIRGQVNSGALIDTGESMKRMAEVKDSLDIDVKQNFIDPLQAVADKDIKDIQHHLKKLEGRRLDYDYKKKRQGKIQDEEIRQALEKFHESKEMAESSMHNLLETDYHKQAAQILEELSDKLRERVIEAQNRPKREYTPKPRPAIDFGEIEQSNGGYSPAASSPPGYSPVFMHHLPLYPYPLSHYLPHPTPMVPLELGLLVHPWNNPIVTIHYLIGEGVSLPRITQIPFVLGAQPATLMAAAPVRQRSGPGGPRTQLPPCYYEGYLEKRGPKEKYVEKLDLSGFVSLKDDCSRDRNLEAARLILRMKDGETKLTLNVPSCLTLLPGQLQMLKEVVDKERSRRRTRTPTRAPPSPLSVPLVGEIPPSVFRHYRVTQRDQGGYVIDVENPIPCATLHEVIDALVEKTAGTLQPFLLEEPYEENINRWCSSPLSRSPASDRRILTSPVPASPTNPMRRLILSPSPLAHTLNEELKMKLEKRRASQE
ncbi:hypothetical protein INR49_010532 [Caranx melampygus]|nr:hypothetical protein INR49_010532 [Caranx melampygus]